MRPLILALALTLSACGAVCPTERATVQGLRDITATLDGPARILAEEELTAAEEALRACEDEIEGEWCRAIMLLTMKVAAEVMATR